jgi:hypothetical protein
MRSLPDDGVELCRAHAKVPRNAYEIVAKLAHFLPVLEPVAEQIDDVFVWLAMACSLTC